MQTSAAKARQHLGYCPQQNVLYNDLTVWEHLLLFAAIKGMPGGPFGPEAAHAASAILEVG